MGYYTEWGGSTTFTAPIPPELHDKIVGYRCYDQFLVEGKEIFLYESVRGFSGDDLVDILYYGKKYGCL